MKKSQSMETLGNYLKPGEYGRPHKPDGWAVITSPRLGDQKIYLTSLRFREGIKEQYNINEKNIVDLRKIPETIPIDAKIMLQQFTDRLRSIKDTHENILIHCMKGKNRTPVAATIYLMMKGFNRNEAENLVIKTLTELRDRNFKLNPYGHYTTALDQAEKEIQLEEKEKSTPIQSELMPPKLEQSILLPKSMEEPQLKKEESKSPRSSRWSGALTKNELIEERAPILNEKSVSDQAASMPMLSPDTLGSKEIELADERKKSLRSHTLKTEEPTPKSEKISSKSHWKGLPSKEELHSKPQKPSPKMEKEPKKESPPQPQKKDDNEPSAPSTDRYSFRKR